MPMRTVLGFVAYVADTGAGKPLILKGAQGKVYSVNDVGLSTPLACRDLATEAVIPNPVSNEDGFIPPFKVSISDTATGLLWVAGAYAIYQPFVGLKGPKGDVGGLDATTSARLTNLDGLGQRGYTIDQSAGRTVKVWDYLNNREQLIYGDTGWRSLTVPSAAPLDGTGTIKIRRTGSQVHMQFDQLGYTGDGTPEYITPAGFVPDGFRPEYSDNPGGWVSNTNTNRFFFVMVLKSSQLRFAHYLAGIPATGSGGMRGQVSWATNQPWPTALPGTE